MRTLLTKLHLYAGLVALPYLLIWGISALQFNHNFEFMKPKEQVTEWTRPVTPVIAADSVAMAGALRDSLGLMGWTPWWQIKRSDSTFQFKVNHPGKEYDITVVLAEKIAKVREIHQGIWPIINGLHTFSGEIPNKTPRIASWRFFQRFCIFYFVFAVVTGVYLWWSRRSERISGLLILGGCTAASILLMAWLWYAG